MVDLLAKGEKVATFKSIQFNRKKKHYPTSIVRFGGVISISIGKHYVKIYQCVYKYRHAKRKVLICKCEYNRDRELRIVVINFNVEFLFCVYEHCEFQKDWVTV